jgi:hypothetical protein
MSTWGREVEKPRWEQVQVTQRGQGEVLVVLALWGVPQTRQWCSEGEHKATLTDLALGHLLSYMLWVKILTSTTLYSQPL